MLTSAYAHLRSSPTPTNRGRSAAVLACLVIVLAVLGLFSSAYPSQSALSAPVVRVVALPTPRVTPIPPKPTAAPQTPKPDRKDFVQVPKPKPPKGSVPARVAAAWPGDDVWALRTVKCESGFNPGSTGGTGGRFWGLWQFGPWARARDGLGDPRRQSVEVQTKRAWNLIKVTNSGQWSCSPYWYDP